MVDREKVIKGLECCILHDPDDKQRCSECPYEGNCVNRLKMDALSLLKAQEPRVMSIEELEETGEPVFIELKTKCHEVKRFENLMYKGCEPHWHCIHCDNYWAFHCYRKKDLEQMECPARNERLVLFDADE